VCLFLLNQIFLDDGRRNLLRIKCYTSSMNKHCALILIASVMVIMATERLEILAESGEDAGAKWGAEARVVRLERIAGQHPGLLAAYSSEFHERVTVLDVLKEHLLHALNSIGWVKALKRRLSSFSSGKRMHD
jgi:hypothetical protein